MEKTNAIKKKKGMTLVEIILVLGIFSLVVLSISSIFVIGTRNQIEVLLMKEVQENSRYLMELITKEIRMGHSFPSEGEYIVFPFRDQNDNLVTYEFKKDAFDKDRLFKTIQGVSNPIDSPGVEITGKFILKEFDVTSPNVTNPKIPRITIVMKIKAERAGQKAEIDLQNTISPRSPFP